MAPPIAAMSEESSSSSSSLVLQTAQYSCSRRIILTTTLTAATTAMLVVAPPPQRKEATRAFALEIEIPGIPEQKSYSSNARNMERLTAGDKSGGSIYNNTPSNPAAAKRRAMVGCKVPSARQAAAVNSEKECNTRVMGGDMDFMLEALRKLDCPTCPYGIKGA